jgi:hypothetical protein
MRRLALLALLAAASPAFADANLVGLEVRSTDRDSVVGEVVDVRDGQAIIQLEAHDQTIAIDLGQLQRDGNKLSLSMSEDELAQMPPLEETAPGNGAPDGGTTPGWGAPQGGWTGPEYR